jgi:MraZ protein
MLLTGTFTRALDEKQRLAIPKRFRAAIGHPKEDLLYITPGTDGSLALYSEKEFEKLIGQIQGSDAEQDMRAFNRLFYAQAQCAEIDNQGRVRIPPELCELAGLSKEIILLGVRDHMELWDKGRWDSYLDDKQPHFDNLVEHAFGADVSDPDASDPDGSNPNSRSEVSSLKNPSPSDPRDEAAKKHPK